MGTLELILFVLILAGAGLWAGRSLWRTLRRQLRPGEEPAAGCASEPGGCSCSGCPVAGLKDAANAPCDREHEARSSG